MFANGHPACSPFAAPEPILQQINLATRRGDFQAEAGKLPVPKVAIRLAGLGGIYRSFCDIGSSQTPTSLASATGQRRGTCGAFSKHIVSTAVANSKNLGETRGMKTP